MAFLARCRPLGLKVVVGILPLASSRNAEFLHHHVPGMRIPDDVLGRFVEVEVALARASVLVFRPARSSARSPSASHVARSNDDASFSHREMVSARTPSNSPSRAAVKPSAFRINAKPSALGGPSAIAAATESSAACAFSSEQVRPSSVSTNGTATLYVRPATLRVIGFMIDVCMDDITFKEGRVP